MNAHGLRPGDRIYHRKWATRGTVIRILDDESIGIKCDNARGVEAEADIADVDQIPGQVDPAVPSIMADFDPDFGPPGPEHNALRAAWLGYDHPDL